MTQGDAVKVTLPDQKIPGKRLGRHIHHDARSRDFPAERASRISSVRHNATGLPLDQEVHTCCTAHALCAALDSNPNFTGDTPLTSVNAIRIYERATRLEGKPASAETETGSSGLMACKAAQQLGLIGSYRHAFGVEHALRALTLRPVMTGFSWYTSFDEPDRETGLVEISEDATVRGGHEVLAYAIDTDVERVWFWNSWGTEYGVNGRFCMSFDTWHHLLDQRGDVTVPLG